MIGVIRLMFAGLSPLGWVRLVAATASVAVLGWLVMVLIDHGRRSALDEVRGANAAAAGAADAIERQVLDCPDDNWVRGGGCVRR